MYKLQRLQSCFSHTPYQRTFVLSKLQLLSPSYFSPSSSLSVSCNQSSLKIPCSSYHSSTTMTTSSTAPLPSSKRIKTTADPELQTFITKVNNDYEKVHVKFENDFWSTKMNLKDASTDSLTRNKNAMEAFLNNKGTLEKSRAWMAKGSGDEDQMKVLKCFIKTFECYIMEDEECIKLKEEINALEVSLEQSRGKMELGYTKSGENKLTKASSVALRNVMKMDKEETVRKSAYEGLRGIGPFVSKDFAAIVIKRNQLAKKLGYVDFYDYKVTQAEGFSKEKLFTILDDLELKSRSINEKARALVKTMHGESALEPCNLGFCLSGDVNKKMDPYFPFAKAVEAWGRTFHALGIEYRGATMNLDLLDREGKYSNGFCHWPKIAYVKEDGTWVPSTANFTSLADPAAIGSGKTGLQTLLHEGGHAAHFANVVQSSPLFSQERSPTSVAYAENQSMFLDSLIGDSSWMGLYARNLKGEPIPWEIVAESIKATRPFEVFGLRAMLAVPYFEKALYELPENEVTPEKIIALADEIELKIQGGFASRPLLSVPHIISDESSCYYHGYVLAEMSVHQTRSYFLNTKKERIVLNPNVGKELAEVYWKPGNSESFLDLVKKLTGFPLTADAWVNMLEEDVDDVLKTEEKEWQWAVKQDNVFDDQTDIDLKMICRIVDGDLVIADSDVDGGFLKTCAKFEKFVQERAATAS